MIQTTRVDDFRQRLTEYLEAVTGQEVEIEAVKPLTGGTSRDSWFVKAEINDKHEQYVVRRDRPTRLYKPALKCDQEFQIMNAAYAAGVKLPRPRWYCLEPAILEQPFLIMDYVEGAPPPWDPPPQGNASDALKPLPEQLGEQLAKIHAIDPNQSRLSFLLRPRPGYSPVQETLAQIRASIQKLNLYNPVFEFGLRWLEHNRPSSSQTVLLHGDFRVANILAGESGLNAVIDWEFARIGDPLEDLAWPCLRHWRCGSGEQHFGGIAAREPFLKAYERASGREVDRKAVDYWEIVGNLRWAVACLVWAEGDDSADKFSIERATLGRQSAEMQYEMLRLISAQGLKDYVRPA